MGKIPVGRRNYPFCTSAWLVHSGSMDSAEAELNKLKLIHDTLVNVKDVYQATRFKFRLKYLKHGSIEAGENRQALN
jgi:hypothetical protein